MRFMVLMVIVFLYSCSTSENIQSRVYVSGSTMPSEEYVTIGKDTIKVINGNFSDTLLRDQSEYNYLKLGSWKWPSIIYLEKGKKLKLNFGKSWISTSNKINEFLLNQDSILIPYTAMWNMSEKEFRNAWSIEFPQNKNKIYSFLKNSKTSQKLIDELIQMEYLKRGHRTANFISFQKDQGIEINRNIYDFVDSIDLKNERLAFHVSNYNFQYFYYTDMVSDSTPESIYPFVAIDTINKYVALEKIKDGITRSIIRSGFKNPSVNHEALIKTYKENTGELTEDDKILKYYQLVQKLKPDNIAPDFGLLLNSSGDSTNIEDLKGENVLLSAWGTWCPFCKEELPHLKKLMKLYPDKFLSVAISLDDDSKKWKDYLVKNNWEGTHLSDPNRNSVFRENYLISGTNVYYLIDKNGIIKSSGIKPSNAKLVTLIEQLD